MIDDIHWKDPDGDEGRVSFDRGYIDATKRIGDDDADIVAIVETKDANRPYWTASYLDREHAEKLLAALTEALGTETT